MSDDGLPGWAPMVMSVAGVTVAMDRGHATILRDAVQRALTEPEPTVAFVAVLTQNGVRDLPTFAYVGIEGSSARILLRGEVTAVAHAAHGAATLVTASSVSTWTEVVLTDCTDVEVRALPGDEGDTVAIVSMHGLPLSEPPLRTSNANRSDPVAAAPTRAAADDTVLPEPERSWRRGSAPSQAHG